MLYCCCGKSSNTVNDVFSFSLLSISNNRAETSSVLLPDKHYGVTLCCQKVCLVCWWRREGWGWGGACLTSSESLFSNASISVSLSLCMHHSLNPPPLPLAGDRSERSQGGLPGFIVLSDCPLPLSIREARTHRHTCAPNSEPQAVQGWHTTVHKVHKHTHTRSHTSHVYTFIQVGNLVHTAKTLVWLRFGWSLPTGLVRLRWLRLNTYGKYWRIQKKPNADISLQ